MGVEGSGALKGSKKKMEGCGRVLPLEKEDILEGIERSDTPSLRWLDMVCRAESDCF